MKIIEMENKIILYLYDNELSLKNFKTLEENLKELFIRLRKYYDLKIHGFYNVYIYNDSKYGSVLELLKEDILDFDYLMDEVDMKIEIKDTNFLFKYNDILEIDKKLLNKFEIHKNLLKPKFKLTKMELANILEYATLIYNE